MKNQKLLVKSIFKAVDIQDEIAVKMQKVAESELKSIPENLQKLAIKTFPLLPYNILAVKKLRSLLVPELQKELIASKVKSPEETDPLMAGLKELVEKLTANKTNALIMTMGKGGVGKTLTASALAVMIAKRGFEVHLTTTDPAAHVQDFMD